MRYDTLVKKWEEIADMLEETGDAFGEATKDKNLRRWRKHRDKNSVLEKLWDLQYLNKWTAILKKLDCFSHAWYVAWCVWARSFTCSVENERKTIVNWSLDGLTLRWTNGSVKQPYLAALAGMTESRFLMAVYLNSPKGVLDKLKVVK